MVTIAVKTRFNKNFYEYEAWNNNALLCGIDEVGRGCLAGPVVIAAVVLRPNKVSRHLKDSKVMTQEERLKAYNWIIKNSWHSISLMHHRAINELNIYQATLKAMKRAFLQLNCQLPTPVSTVVVDAMPLQLASTVHHATNVYHFPFAESKSSTIAAASIVAKVTRDALVINNYDQLFPKYGLKSHKGYATPLHQQTLLEHGMSIIHRPNYVATILNKYTHQKKVQENVLSIFEGE